MDLSADAWMPFPRPIVYAAYRDELTRLVPFLPNIREIEVMERRDEGSTVHLVNIWHGGGEIPAAARAFLSEKMLSWTDLATWVAPGWHCDWKTVPYAFSEAVSCQGRNTFHEANGGTRLEIRGTLSIDGRKIRGVPGFMSGTVGRVVEEFLVGRIQPNLIEVSQGLARYLEDRGG